MGMNGEWTLMNKCRWIDGIEQTDDDERQMEWGQTKSNRWTTMDIGGNGDGCRLEWNCRWTELKQMLDGSPMKI